MAPSTLAHVQQFATRRQRQSGPQVPHSHVTSPLVTWSVEYVEIRQTNVHQLGAVAAVFDGSRGTVRYSMPPVTFSFRHRTFSEPKLVTFTSLLSRLHAYKNIWAVRQFS